MPEQLDDAIAAARDLVSRGRRVVVLSGAGISTESGIPDYRGPEGVWTKDPEAERLARIEVYLRDAEARKAAWRNRLRSPVWAAKPNAAHRALVDLERQGRLDTLVTQNIDGLHQLAGNDPSKIVEIHGTIREVVCVSCRDRGPAEDALGRVRAGEEDPPCLHCGGILKTATISFGESLVVADLRRAERATLGCDVLLVVGTSLAVYPAAGLVPLAAERGAAVVIVNEEPTPLDGVADAIVHARLGAVLPAIAAA
jgi:NAD-dependent deacetylase